MTVANRDIFESTTVMDFSHEKIHKNHIRTLCSVLETQTTKPQKRSH